MLIDENQAALSLGITKELLFAYVKYGAKGKKLEVYENEENKFFRDDDLVEWDRYLNEPWSSNSSDKPDIPTHIRDYLKVESGGQCSRCYSGHRLDNAHIVPWADSLSHHPHNLIRLCSDCHTKYDDGIISKSEIQKIKAELIARIRSEILSQTEFFEKISHQLPTLKAGFIGRKKEINNLTKLFEKSRIVFIVGIGGMGKTQLLLKVLNSKKQHVLWFDVEKYSSLKDLKLAVLKSVNSTSMNEFLTSVDQSELVVVMDGLENLLHGEWDQVVNFLKRFIDSTTKMKLVVTSQVNFSNTSIHAEIFKLDKGLSNNDSFNVLNSFTPILKKDNEGIKELIRFADGHPLTLRIISGLIDFMRDPLTVLKSINEVGLKVIEDPGVKTKTKETSLQICLATAYSMLDVNQKWLLKYLNNFPAGCKEYFLGILTTEKENTKFRTEYDLNRAVSVLQRFNFLNFESDLMGYPRFSMSSPLKAFVKHQAKSDSMKEFHEIKISAFNNLMLETLLLYDRYMLSENIRYAITRYEMELPNYLNAIKSAVHSAYCEKCQQFSDRKDYLHLITGFASGLYKYLFTRGFFAYGIYLNEEGAKAHVELKEYDLAIDDLAQVAALHWRMYNVEEVRITLNKLKEYELKAEKRFVAIRLIEGELVRNSNPNEAIGIFEDGIVLCTEELDKHDSISARGNMASLISEIGKTYERNLRDYKKALEYYEKGYRIQEEIKDYSNMFCNSHHMGNCYDGIGDFRNAILFYREALKGFIKFGQQQYIGNSLSELGRMRIQHPDFDFTFLTEDTLTAGLKDIETEIILMLKTCRDEEINLNAIVYDEQIYKLWNIIKITSLSEHSHILKEWVLTFGKKLEVDPRYFTRVSYLIVFLKIAHLSCDIEKCPNDEDKIVELKDLCYLYGGEVEHDIYDPYEWLSQWLKQKGIDKNATRGDLFADVESRIMDEEADYDDVWEYE